MAYGMRYVNVITIMARFHRACFSPTYALNLFLSFSLHQPLSFYRGDHKSKNQELFKSRTLMHMNPAGSVCFVG